MPILSSRRHRVDMHLRYHISATRQVGLARQVDFERPHVCNACTWQSPYLLQMTSTINSMNRCPSACPLFLVASGMTLADLQAYIDFTRFEMYVHGCSMHQA